jgi:hypothetical protein
VLRLTCIFTLVTLLLSCSRQQKVELQAADASKPTISASSSAAAIVPSPDPTRNGPLTRDDFAVFTIKGELCLVLGQEIERTKLEKYTENGYRVNVQDDLATVEDDGLLARFIPEKNSIYRLSSIDITSAAYMTYRGIVINDTDERLQTRYELEGVGTRIASATAYEGNFMKADEAWMIMFFREGSKVKTIRLAISEGNT